MRQILEILRNMIGDRFYFPNLGESLLISAAYLGIAWRPIYLATPIYIAPSAYDAFIIGHDPGRRWLGASTHSRLSGHKFAKCFRSIFLQTNSRGLRKKLLAQKRKKPCCRRLRC